MKQLPVAFALALVGLGLGLGARAASAAPHGIYIEQPPSPYDIVHDPQGGPLILFLNGNGATYYPGPNDALDNTVNFLQQTANISAFSGTDAEWEYLVDCVKYQYARWNITVTDVNPGNVNHIEASVGGEPGDAGMDDDVGGVAPYTCNALGSAVVFNFAEVYGSNMDELCFTIAQESAHALSLDHEYDCEDPMTYLNGCGFKTFQDVDNYCGRYEVETCSCGRGARQNSVEELDYFVGRATDNASPTVSITAPTNDGFAAVGQEVLANINDDRAIERVEWWIDGDMAHEQRFGPYAWDLPATLALGAHSVEVRVWDIAGKTATDAADFVLTVNGQPPECEEDSECPDEEICYQLQCWPDNIVRGALGAPCASNEECLTGLCGYDGSDRLCTQECDGDCPEGFECVSAGAGSVCWPGDGGGGGEGGGETGGCASQGGGGGLGGVLAAMLCMLGMALFRRRA